MNTICDLFILDEPVTFTSSVSVAQIGEPPDVSQPHGVSQTREEVFHFTTPRLSVAARVAPPTSDDVIGGYVILQQSRVFFSNDEARVLRSYKYLVTVDPFFRHLNSKAFNTIHTSKDCYKYSFFPRTIKDWNSLPYKISTIKECQTFKLAF